MITKFRVHKKIFHCRVIVSRRPSCSRCHRTIQNMELLIQVDPVACHFGENVLKHCFLLLGNNICYAFFLPYHERIINSLGVRPHRMSVKYPHNLPCTSCMLLVVPRMESQSSLSFGMMPQIEKYCQHTILSLASKCKHLMELLITLLQDTVFDKRWELKRAASVYCHWNPCGAFYW